MMLEKQQQQQFWAALTTMWAALFTTPEKVLGSLYSQAVRVFASSGVYFPHTLQKHAK